MEWSYLPCILVYCYLIDLLIKYLHAAFFYLNVYSQINLSYIDKGEGNYLGTWIPRVRVFSLSDIERGITWCMTPYLQGCTVFDFKKASREVR